MKQPVHCMRMLIAMTGLAAVSGMAQLAQAEDGRPASQSARSSAPMLLAQAARPSPAALQGELEALIKAARAEGDVTFYSSATENVAKQIGDAFTAKYGVKFQFVRLAGAQVPLRYAAEAQTGNFAADLLYIAGSAKSIAPEWVAQGWLDTIAAANLPVVKSGEFPAKFITGATAIVQVTPWYMAYNSQKISAADAPKDWPDLLKPQFKGQILLPDPRSSDSYLDFWALLIDKYGEKFFAPLRAQNLRQYSSGVPAVQALGAGEGMVEVPGVPALYTGIAAKGAPIVVIPVELTTGVEMQVLITARAKAKHPAAARLLANFTMTPEGNKIFNLDPGSLGIYDTSALPRQYVSPEIGVIKRQGEVLKALGIQ